MLMFDDDDDEPQVDVVDNFSSDTQDQPVCISVLPFQFKATDGVPDAKRMCSCGELLILPEETEKNLWIHLRRIFDKFDVRPSEDDFRNHHLLIKQFAEKDLTLAKSQILQAFIQEKYSKKKNKVGSDKVEIKVPFIADDDIDEIRYGYQY
ncbi:hypothetical protein GUJ93_ZPchr0533g6554 [Zizania palustris]|uniref:Uncharacterized protein n=1 Tax=Zizania palustris TaxID=103762 RepID=A0A8J5RIM8_ZIZPA|nr:hypothetical protein GUJ93_ZPchr0533g6554 [Zizania palustris]